MEDYIFIDSVNNLIVKGQDGVFRYAVNNAIVPSGQKLFKPTFYTLDSNLAKVPAWVVRDGTGYSVQVANNNKVVKTIPKYLYNGNTPAYLLPNNNFCVVNPDGSVVVVDRSFITERPQQKQQYGGMTSNNMINNINPNINMGQGIASNTFQQTTQQVDTGTTVGSSNVQVQDTYNTAQTPTNCQNVTTQNTVASATINTPITPINNQTAIQEKVEESYVGEFPFIKPLVIERRREDVEINIDRKKGEYINGYFRDYERDMLMKERIIYKDTLTVQQDQYRYLPQLVKSKEVIEKDGAVVIKSLIWEEGFAKDKKLVSTIFDKDSWDEIYKEVRALDDELLQKYLILGI